MTQQAPGKHLRKGISLIELVRMFPDEETARRWFESMLWPNGPECPHCGCNRVSECKGHIPMPYRCKMCQKHFSVRKGTVLCEIGECDGESAFLRAQGNGYGEIPHSVAEMGHCPLFVQHKP